MSIETYQPPSAPALATDPTGGRLVAWAESLTAAHRIATALCRTSFAPAHFKGKPEDAAAAILYGDEIGFSPTQSLRSVHVISGTPGLYARAMVALVMSHGHEVWTEEDTPAKVIVCGRRKGSEHIERSVWTIDRARKAGYLSNKKYDTDPQAMLYARASGDVCRKVAPDALAGLAYNAEELELAEAPTTVTVARDPEKRTARRAVAVVEPVEPPLDEPVPDEPTVEDPPAEPLWPAAREVPA